MPRAHWTMDRQTRAWRLLVEFPKGDRRVSRGEPVKGVREVEVRKAGTKPAVMEVQFISRAFADPETGILKAFAKRKNK